MGNLFLALALLSSLSIVMLLRIYEKRGYDRYVVIASNYLTAGTAGFLFLTDKKMPGADVLIFSTLIGLLFFISFSLFSYSLKRSGMASTVTFGRLSLAVPLIASIVLWGETPTSRT
jgi:drug/metabolite transporter (DMT)-like permease